VAIVVLAPIRSEPCAARTADSSSSAARSIANSASARWDARALPGRHHALGRAIEQSAADLELEVPNSLEIAGWLTLSISAAFESFRCERRRRTCEADEG
jgi:hypothetical protein